MVLGPNFLEVLLAKRLFSLQIKDLINLEGYKFVDSSYLAILIHHLIYLLLGHFSLPGAYISCFRLGSLRTVDFCRSK
jgi:hypothetical protein